MVSSSAGQSRPMARRGRNSQRRQSRCFRAPRRRRVSSRFSATIWFRAMPIFDYQCRTCKTQFELLVIGKTVPECPACHGQDLEQLLSGFAVSSEGMRLSNAAKSRRAQRASRDFIEQNVAQAEYEKSHEH